MNKHLENILLIIQQDESLPGEQKNAITQSLKDADKEFEVTALKLDRTEKVKRTTAILLQETIEELEQKRKAVEAQNRELEIEAALEKVRNRTLVMKESRKLNEAVAVFFQQFQTLNLLPTEARTYFCHINANTATADVWMTHADGTVMQSSHQTPLKNSPSMVKYFEAWKRKEPIVVRNYSGELLKEYLQFLSSLPHVKADEDYQRVLDSPPEKIVMTDANFLHGNIGIMTFEPLTQEASDILIRFAKVFEFTYTRFLDLQTAEAQAREAKIEAALERTRTQSMIMQHSKELDDTLRVFHEQVQLLDINSAFSFLWLPDEQKEQHIFWAIWEEDKGGSIVFKNKAIKYPLDRNEPATAQCLVDWKGNEPVVSYQVPPAGVENYFAAWKELIDSVEKLSPKYFRGGLHYVEAFMKYGCFGVMLENDLAENEKKILGRFAIEFERTYTRFLDLQKAEAQAREAQIQLALERVRARTMAMQKSDELQDAANLLFLQVQALNIPVWSCGYNIWEKDDKQCTGWMSSEGFIQPPFKIPLTENPTFIKFYESRKKGESFYAEEVDGAALAAHYQYMLTLPDFAPIAEKHVKAGLPLPSFQINHVANFAQGNLIFITSKPVPEAWEVFKRFAKVFEQTYTRFLDLQKAEAQAREATVEAALERVRAKTMAMHSSEDVSSATATMFTELEKLGIENFRGGITIIKTNRTQEVWSVNNLAEGKAVRAVGILNIDAHPFWQLMYKEWETRKDFLHYFLAGKDKDDYVKILNTAQGYLQQALQQFPDVHFQVYYFNEGVVWTNSMQPHSEEDKQIMKRFTSVFSLTFRRYLNLKQVEAQAREATIEAALEKVRGKAMAMHNSNDLSSTASMVFTELRKLSINFIRSGVGLLNKENRKVILYSATSSEEGDNLSLVGWAMLHDHPVLSMIYDSWVRRADYFPVLKGDLLKTYYEKILSSFAVPGSHYEKNLRDNALTDSLPGYEQHGHFLAFSEGFLYGWSEKPYTETEITILNRFKIIIDLTFRRYMELQKSEANAREAVKQAALDRVRADIASMRTIADLDRITPLIWNELTILGVPFIRCGVFIMDELQQLIHTFLSTPNGKAIAAFNIPYDTPGNIAQVLSHWQLKKNYSDHWDQAAFTEFADTLVKQGVLASPDQYLKTLPTGGFYLHFLPFLQGMLYVGNTTQLGDDEIILIQHVADAFATAYARYEDFNKLEAAKQQVDKTLVDLKLAQTQLVQSEKMASLGELTAGIAHEIQNPLNFVNNFSEESNELIKELKSEKLKIKSEQDDELEKQLLGDIEQNLEKINHHGKRADAIVKNMLQHSRQTSSKKELININALADEYLRLIYHGLRAKDNTFNVTIKTDFDESIGNINIIPQDISRVLLNLYNNAFYAVHEKVKLSANNLPTEQAGYQPTVIVNTKKADDKILISVKDNGMGIPQKVLDKIYQPFFTTKPTGQGTGLGLSLSYDIIKAHGGELKVQTKEDEGAKFIIELPIKEMR